MSVNNNTNLVVLQQQEDAAKIGLIGLLMIAGSVALAIQYWYITLTTVVVATALTILYRRAMARAAMAARADQQHAWVMEGDDRGIYGGCSDEGPFR